MKQQLFCVVEGTTYKTMPMLTSMDAGCIGCAAAEKVRGLRGDTELCKRLSAEYEAVMGYDETWSCIDVVWIPDTPKGLADYAITKLES